MLTIREAQASDAEWLQTSFDTQMHYQKRTDYFAEVCDLQAQDKAVLLFARMDENYAGHLKIIWEPNYPYYKENSIPEIQDLNVLHQYRRQGIATQLLDEAESRIAQRSNIVGIGFGLYADYGAAQRLYIQRGYIPDGRGVSYRDAYPQPGATIRLDNDLVLHLIKRL